MLNFEIYDLDVPDYEVDLMKKTVENHMKRWDVTKPKKWEGWSLGNIVSNIRFEKNIEDGGRGPVLTFDNLMYNYVYDLVDKWIEKHCPENSDSPYIIEQIWYNRYDKNASTPVHNHYRTNGIEHPVPPICCGCYYLEIPKDGDRFLNIYDKMPEDGGKITQALRPQPNQLYLFDAGLFHGAAQKNTENASIAIVFNVHLVKS